MFEAIKRAVVVITFRTQTQNDTSFLIARSSNAFLGRKKSRSLREIIAVNMHKRCNRAT